jgi:dTDP-4-dehydrorhamnose 3,5-epimerase
VIQRIEELEISGTFVLHLHRFDDSRGILIKPFQRQLTSSLGLKDPLAEVFFSESHKNVLRGLHLQTPPSEQWKLVFCCSGSALDVVFDMRQTSPTFGTFHSIELCARTATALLIPPGVAHGFLARQDTTVLCYCVTKKHSPEHDEGVRWNSIGFDWPGDDFIISRRDKELPPFSRTENQSASR